MLGLREVAECEDRVVEQGIAKVCFVEVGTAEISKMELRTAEAGISEAGPAWIGMAEVKMDRMIFLAPFVPRPNAPFELGELLEICHASIVCSGLNFRPC